MQKEKPKIKLQFFLKYFSVQRHYFFGEHLLRARERAGISQEELAEKIRFWTQQRISKIEASSKPHSITASQIEKVNKALNQA